MKTSLIGLTWVLLLALSFTYSYAQTQQSYAEMHLSYAEAVKAAPLDPLLYQRHLKSLMADYTWIKEMTPDQINREADDFGSNNYGDLSESSRDELRKMEIKLIARYYKELLSRVDHTKSGRLVQLRFNVITVGPPPPEAEQSKEKQEMKEEREKEATDLKEYRLRDAIYYLQGASERYVASELRTAVSLNQAKDILKKAGFTDEQVQVLTTGPNKKLVPYE